MLHDRSITKEIKIGDSCCLMCTRRRQLDVGARGQVDRLCLQVIEIITREKVIEKKWKRLNRRTFFLDRPKGKKRKECEGMR